MRANCLHHLIPFICSFTLALGSPARAQTNDSVAAGTAIRAEVDQASGGALVRWVRNRVVLHGPDIAGAAWVEVRSSSGSLRGEELKRTDDNRLACVIPLPADFAGPATITVGFADDARAFEAGSMPVIDPVVQPALAPVDEQGKRQPVDVSAGDRLLKAFSPQSIQCVNPSIPYVSWVDTTSVAPPPSVCNGWPREFRSTQGLIYYFQDQMTGQIIGQNCPVRFKLEALDRSGFHCHSDANRPAGVYNPKVGNTGPSGEEFDVLHEWPRSSSLLKGTFWSTQSGCPSFNDSTTARFFYIIAGAVAFGPDVFELSPGSGYNLKPPTTAHPDAYWGLMVMNQALQAVAAEYTAATGGGQLSFNDMGLPLGGTFDAVSLNWNPQHCGHQVGNEMDFRSKFIPNTQRLARMLFEKHNFVPKLELVGTAREHWHVKYYGPGTYRGPGNTLSRP